MFKIRFSRTIRQNTVTRTRENHLRQLLYSEAHKLNNVWARVTPVRFFFVKLSFLPHLFPFILHISFYFVQSESSQFLEFQGSSSKIWYGWTASKFPHIAPMVVISRILTISRIKPIRSLQFCTPTEAQQKKKWIKTLKLGTVQTFSGQWYHRILDYCLHALFWPIILSWACYRLLELWLLCLMEYQYQIVLDFSLLNSYSP